jgi:3-hydroxybutyryl-CoA dehydrogenase
MNEKLKVAIVGGGGVMGSGIGFLTVLNGLPTTLIDRTKDDAEVGIRRIEEYIEMSKGIQKLWLKMKKRSLMKLLRTSDDISIVNNSDVVIEAIPEKKELKKEVLRNISEYLPKDAILATNTSSIMVKTLSEGLRNPENFLGIHFFNPPVLMKLVEIIKTEDTSDHAIELARKFCKMLDRKIIEPKDTPGFVANRLFAALFKEAFNLYESGIATPKDIDTAAKFGLGHRLGPFKTMDLIGIDTGKDVIDSINEQSGEKMFEVPEVLKAMIRNGTLGMKTGKGFFDYKKQK